MSLFMAVAMLTMKHTDGQCQRLLVAKARRSDIAGLIPAYCLFF